MIPRVVRCSVFVGRGWPPVDGIRWRGGFETPGLLNSVVSRSTPAANKTIHDPEAVVNGRLESLPSGRLTINDQRTTDNESKRG
jgi:hypothetical protein